MLSVLERLGLLPLNPDESACGNSDQKAQEHVFEGKGRHALTPPEVSLWSLISHESKLAVVQPPSNFCMGAGFCAQRFDEAMTRRSGRRGVSCVLDLSLQTARRFARAAVLERHARDSVSLEFIDRDRMKKVANGDHADNPA
jgi:hypothetical protein